MTSPCQIACFVLLEALLLISTATGQEALDPCQPGKHKELNDVRRSTGYMATNLETPLCDLELEEGWYRFTSGAGGQMPTTCQEKNRCGTIVPLWMRGTHPSVADGIVNRQVCGRFTEAQANACCDQPMNIRVKNCAQFFVYHLLPAPSCSVAYCAGEKIPCPAGKWSPTGFPPCKDAYPILKNPPTLKGPNILDKSFDFQCEFTYDQRDPDQAFEVVWTFDGNTDMSVPPQVLADPSRMARLDGAKLKSHLNSNIACKVRSFYKQNTGQKSEYLLSTAYYAGIQINPAELVVSERDFSKTVHVTSTVPVICNDGRASCCLTFRLDIDTQQMSVGNRCSYMMCTSNWDMTTKSASIKVPVVANQDLIRDGDKRVLMTFENLLPAAGGPYLDVFALHKVNQLPVVIQDQDTSSCSITGDPHISGFDYRTYHLYKIGDFTVYEVPSRHFQIQIRTWSCWKVTCVCGLVIREKNDFIRIDQCDQIYGGGNTSPVVSVARDLREGTIIQRSQNGQTIAVYLPSGVEVKTDALPKYLNVYITGPGTDRGKAKGLCGTNDGRKDNEFTHPNGRVDRICADGVDNCMPNEFFEAWRASRQNSLFHNVPRIVDDPDEVAYCGCNNKERVVNCSPEANIKSPQMLCKNCVKVKPPVIDVRPRRKREVVYEDTDTPDFLYETTNADANIVIDTNKLWPSDGNMTETKARALCTEALKKSQLNSMCGQMADMAATAMSDCMSDILHGGTTEFLDAITSAFTVECQLTLAKDPANYVTNSEGRQVMKPEYVDDICDMACEKHGRCDQRGICVCDNGWEGDNCHMQSGKGPQLDRIRSGRFCDKSQRPCERVYLDVSNINLSDDLICRVKPVDEKGDIAGTSNDTQAIVMSGHRIACSLPKIDVFSQRFMVSASNDGVLFGNEMPLHVFDSNCMDCSEAGCTLKTSPSCTRNASPLTAHFNVYNLILLTVFLLLFSRA